MDDFEALEADFAAPFFEIGGGIIVGCAINSRRIVFSE